VDGLEQRYRGRLAVRRVDYNSTAGRQLAQRYQVRAHPAVVVIDRQSEAIYAQAGIPDAGRVEQAIDQALEQE
jgi:thioredoxin-related protein